MIKIKLSIKYKLIFLITLSSLASSLIGLYLINLYIQNRTEDFAIHESKVFAKLIGEYLVPAIAFNDSLGAVDIVSKAKLIDRVKQIVVYDTSGNHFLDYTIDKFENGKISSTDLLKKDTSYIVSNNLIVESKIRYNDVDYGFIIITSKYEIYNIMEKELNLSLLVLLSIILLISFVISFSFQNVISKPIKDLTKIAYGVLEQDNYDIRLKNDRNDEVGLLNQTFNDMFSKIRKHNEDREKAINIMRENEKKYRVLFDYSPIPIFLFNNGICTLSNYASFNLFKTEIQNDIIGKNYKEIFHSENSRSYESIFYHRQFNRRQISSDFTIIDKQNVVKQVELSSILIHNEELSSTIVMCVDINEKSQYEKILLKLNEELESRVLQRTTTINETLKILKEQNQLLYEQEKELSQAKDMAEKANKIKSDFIAKISHEIRTPMNIIKGYSELLYKRVENPENTRILKTIVYSSEMLLSIINDILDLSKIEAGKLEILPSFFDFKRNFFEIYDMFVPKCDEIGLNLYFEIQDEFPRNVNLDRVRFNQIIFNLISNALKFTKSGYIRVKCNFEKVDDRTIDIILNIEDTGVGIDEKNLEYIFDAFTQEKVNTVSYQMGTGLGLTITKILVEKMNGLMHVESKINVGTTFYVVLKNVLVDLSDSVLQNNESPVINYQDLYKILIVDDYDLNRQVLRIKLEEYGIKCYEASDLVSTIDIINNYSFDLIFLDLIMPKDDGVVIAREIKKLNSYNNCPIIAYSASNNYLNEENSFLFDDFLNKPIKNKALIDLLKKYLNRASFGKYFESIIDNSYSITSQNIDEVRLNELIDLLDKDLIDYSLQLSESLIIDDIKDFNNYLKEQSQIFNIDIFTQFTSNLDTAINNLDIKVFQKYLQNFDKLKIELEQLKVY